MISNVKIRPILFLITSLLFLNKNLNAQNEAEDLVKSVCFPCVIGKNYNHDYPQAVIKKFNLKYENNNWTGDKISFWVNPDLKRIDQVSISDPEMIKNLSEYYEFPLDYKIYKKKYSDMTEVTTWGTYDVYAQDISAHWRILLTYQLIDKNKPKGSAPIKSILFETLTSHDDAYTTSECRDVNYSLNPDIENLLSLSVYMNKDPETVLTKGLTKIASNKMNLKQTGSKKKMCFENEFISFTYQEHQLVDIKINLSKTPDNYKLGYSEGKGIEYFYEIPPASEDTVIMNIEGSANADAVLKFLNGKIVSLHVFRKVSKSMLNENIFERGYTDLLLYIPQYICKYGDCWNGYGELYKDRELLYRGDFKNRIYEGQGIRFDDEDFEWGIYSKGLLLEKEKATRFMPASRVEDAANKIEMQSDLKHRFIAPDLGYIETKFVNGKPSESMLLISENNIYHSYGAFLSVKDGLPNGIGTHRERSKFWTVEFANGKLINSRDTIFVSLSDNVITPPNISKHWSEWMDENLDTSRVILDKFLAEYKKQHVISQYKELYYKYDNMTNILNNAMGWLEFGMKKKDKYQEDILQIHSCLKQSISSLSEMFGSIRNTVELKEKEYQKNKKLEKKNKIQLIDLSEYYQLLEKQNFYIYAQGVQVGFMKIINIELKGVWDFMKE